MKAEEFQKIVSQDPVLAEPLKNAAAAVPSGKFGIELGEAAALVFMFPIARFILVQIGLPWFYEAKRYSELWRLKFHNWIDEKSRKEGIDPDQAEVAGEALRKELEKTTDLQARAAWEKLSKLLGPLSDDAGSKSQSGEQQA
jgi:hypothetical protein